MRLSYLFVITLFLFSSCGVGTNKKVDKKILFGSWEGKTYKNAFVNLKIDFDENWELVKSAPKIRSNFGGLLFESTYLQSNDASYPISIQSSLDLANPFEKPSLVRRINENLEAYDMFYDETEIIKFKPTKSTIAGEEFLLSKYYTIDDTDTSFMNEFYRFKDGYYFTISCSYYTESDEKAAKEFISTLKPLK